MFTTSNAEEDAIQARKSDSIPHIIRATNQTESILGQRGCPPASRQDRSPDHTEHNTSHHSPNDWPATASRHRRNSIATNFSSLHHRGTGLYHPCNNTSNSSEPAFQDISHTATYTAGSQLTTPSANDALATRLVAGGVQVAATEHWPQNRQGASLEHFMYFQYGHNSTSRSAPSISNCSYGQQQARLPGNNDTDRQNKYRSETADHAPGLHVTLTTVQS